MEEKTLFDLKKGEVAIIKNFNDNELPSKLYEIGILPGTKVEIKYSGPFKDPICICFGKSETKLALRKKEAKSILIQPL
ncbi:MAG: ferrous iron transport protein A [Flavobacteriales bacterium]